MWRAVADQATRQQGYVSREQLREAGLTWLQIRTAVRDLRLFPRRHGLFLLGHRHVAPRARWHAALLLGGRGAVLSHRTAAELWGLLEGEQPLEVTAPGRWREKEPVRIHRAQLDRSAWQMRDGFPVTRVLRTIVDLASVLDEATLAIAVNEAAIKGWLGAANLRSIERLMVGRRGARTLRRVLAARDQSRGKTKSWLEKQFAELAREEGLPRYERGAHVDIGGGDIRECDAVFWKQRVMVELDSLRIHESGRVPTRDRRRDRRLAASGWVVIRLCPADFLDHRTEVVADLRAALSRREITNASS